MDVFVSVKKIHRLYLKTLALVVFIRLWLYVDMCKNLFRIIFKVVHYIYASTCIPIVWSTQPLHTATYLHIVSFSLIFIIIFIRQPFVIENVVSYNSTFALHHLSLYHAYLIHILMEPSSSLHCTLTAHTVRFLTSFSNFSRLLNYFLSFAFGYIPSMS